MNFKIEEDIENNVVMVHVHVPSRKKLSDKRERVFLSDVLHVINENYTPPKTHSLGTCLTAHLSLDNKYPQTCGDTWKFSLTPIVKKNVKKAGASKVTKKRSRKQ